MNARIPAIGIYAELDATRFAARQARALLRDAGGPGAPVVRAAGRDGEHGRGLAIIEAVAADWGTRATSTGRSTWCRLTRDRAADRVPERKAD